MTEFITGVGQSQHAGSRSLMAGTSATIGSAYLCSPPRPVHSGAMFHYVASTFAELPFSLHGIPLGPQYPLGFN
eukprot:2781549-Amphidinium_carterae.1